MYFNENSGNLIFFCNEMGIFYTSLNNINLDDTNYNEADPDTIIHIRLLSWHIKFEKRKTLKKRSVVNQWQYRGILKHGKIFPCQKIRKRK